MQMAQVQLNLASVEYNGITHTFDVGHTTYTITTNAGTVVINDDGSYTFTAKANVATDITDSIHYTIQDADGDMSTANLFLTVKDSVPVAVDNFDQR